MPPNQKTKQEKDKSFLAVIRKKREQLVKERLYPQRFSMPLSIQFEVTSRCNLKCRHCYNASGTATKDTISPAAWENLCHNIVAEGGIFHATFSGGEPLLLGNTLWKMMDILHTDNTAFNLLTNGTLVTHEIAKKISDYRMFWVQISLDNFTPERHDNFRGSKGSWTKAARAAYIFANTGTPTRIASTITKHDIGNIEKFVQMAINLGASYLAIGEVMPSGNAHTDEELFLTLTERTAFENEVTLLQKKYADTINISTSGSQRTQLEYAALGPLDGAVIRPDGTVRMDCCCPFVIGDISKNSLREIWKHKSNCWKDARVQEYIMSCEYDTGKSNLLRNYLDEDIWI